MATPELPTSSAGEAATAALGKVVAAMTGPLGPQFVSCRQTGPLFRREAILDTLEAALGVSHWVRLLKFHEATSRDILAPFGAVPFLIAMTLLAAEMISAPSSVFFGRYGPRRLRLQLSVPTKLIETNKHKKTAVKQRSELLNYLLQHADFVSSGCSATRRKFLSATQQK